MDGNKVMGKIQVLETPAGKTLRALVEGGCAIGISSRGTGSVMEQGGKSIVQEDFELVCFDVVSEPSTPGAFMMREAKDFGLKENKNIFLNFFTKIKIFKKKCKYSPPNPIFTTIRVFP